MTKHFGELDLLEHYYLPGESPDIDLHIAGCPDCAAAFATISSKLRADAQRHSLRAGIPDTFWKRQELSLMREIARRESRFRSRWTHLAAAAVLVVVAGGGYWLRSTQPVPAAPPPSSALTQTASIDMTRIHADEEALAAAQMTSDPWQTESIEDFQGVVDWESWVEKGNTDRGTI